MQVKRRADLAMDALGLPRNNVPCRFTLLQMDTLPTNGHVANGAEKTEGFTMKMYTTKLQALF
jgi:hypothetical protein